MIAVQRQAWRIKLTHTSEKCTYRVSRTKPSIIAASAQGVGCPLCAFNLGQRTGRGVPVVRVNRASAQGLGRPLCALIAPHLPSPRRLSALSSRRLSRDQSQNHRKHFLRPRKESVAHSNLSKVVLNQANCR